MRVPAVPVIALVTAALACEGTAPPPPPARTVATARRGASAARFGRRGGNAAAEPPPVDSVAQCPPATFPTLARYRSAGRTLHFGPLCTDVYNGRFSAVMVTGTAEEATDAWVILHDGPRDEVHRVRRFPVGAHITFGRIAQGWVYLLGHGNALEDMPAGAQLLAIFPLARAGDPDPEVRALSPLEVGLLRSSDAVDLDRRLSFPVPEHDPSAREALALVRGIAREGPNGVFDHLSPEGAPTLRAWQVGMFQETDYVSPQGDPTSVRVSHATSLIRSIAGTADCDAGDRCVGRAGDVRAESGSAPLGGAAPPQILLRYEGTRVVIAGLVAAATPPIAATTAVHPWGPEATTTDQDGPLAQTLSVDGVVHGPVIASERQGERVLAFQVEPPAAARAPLQTRVYILRPGHAPRPYEVDPASPTDPRDPAERELHLRDYDRDGGFELVALGRGADGSPAATIASASAPPTVTQHRLTPRLDMLRSAFGDATLRDLDAHLRGFRPMPADPALACALVDRVADGDARTFAAATGGAFTVITYTEPGRPLRGAPRRMERRELQHMAGAREALGPIAGLHCSELSCDWSQSLCRAESPQGELGILWFADGGRRLAAVSRREGH